MAVLFSYVADEAMLLRVEVVDGKKRALNPLCLRRLVYLSLYIITSTPATVGGMHTNIHIDSEYLEQVYLLWTWHARYVQGDFLLCKVHATGTLC